MRTIALFLLFALAPFGQAPIYAQTPTRSVILNWTDARNPAGTTYGIYRATGACTTGLSFAKVATGIAAKTWTDGTVPLGNYCYYVTATYASMESIPSVQAGALVGPWAPEGLSITVNVSVTVGSRTPTPTTQTAWAEVQKLPDPPPGTPTAQVKE